MAVATGPTGDATTIAAGIAMTIGIAVSITPVIFCLVKTRALRPGTLRASGLRR
jgi:hypothetical protein